MDPRELIDQARMQRRAALDERAGKRLLAAYGIAVPKSLVVQDAGQAAAVLETFKPPPEVLGKKV